MAMIRPDDGAADLDAQLIGFDTTNYGAAVSPPVSVTPRSTSPVS